RVMGCRRRVCHSSKLERVLSSLAGKLIRSATTNQRVGSIASEQIVNATASGDTVRSTEAVANIEAVLAYCSKAEAVIAASANPAVVRLLEGIASLVRRNRIESVVARGCAARVKGAVALDREASRRAGSNRPSKAVICPVRIADCSESAE